MMDASFLPALPFHLSYALLFGVLLVAVMLGHVPIGILYLIEVVGQGTAQWWDLLFGVLYLGFFAVVGQPFNQSWGLLTASTWAIAFGFGLQGLERLVRQAR